MVSLFIVLLFAGQKFLADDPVRYDNDAVVEVADAARHKLNDHYDFLLHTFGKPGDRAQGPAANINTLGEVPDSSWFQNRHGIRRLSTTELVRGPDTGSGPSFEKPWQIIEAKTEGITPGFRIRDARGDVYFIKFDPPEYPELATAAEVISTKFFHAIGFNVPENYLVFFNRNQLQASSGLPLDKILKRVQAGHDGNYRALASKLLAGKPLGPFQYFGTRPDDANDIFPHENRRELRGLRVFSAWLNHDDSRAINTLDMLVGENGLKFVKHYLIDFGSTLGSGSVASQKPRAGWEYMWEPKAVLARIATLGLWDREWVRAEYPPYSSIGRFESKLFQPDQWRPEYPNPAFSNMTGDDAYWAAKIVMSFTAEDIRAIVKTGRLSNPEAEEYLVDTLIERRDKIGRTWLTSRNSFDRFELTEDGDLQFDHLGSRYDFVRRPEHQTAWYRFDNMTGRRDAIDRFPAGEHGYFVAVVSSLEGNVQVYVRNLTGRAEIVGVER